MRLELAKFSNLAQQKKKQKEQAHFHIEPEPNEAKLQQDDEHETSAQNSATRRSGESVAN